MSLKPFQIIKTFNFSAAHSLPALPPDHKCHRVHGHNYVVEFCLSSKKLNPLGMVVDFSEISATMAPLVAALDHRNLNDLFSFPTTSENVARYFFLSSMHKLDADLEWVSVSETPGTKAIYAATETQIDLLKGEQ